MVAWGQYPRAFCPYFSMCLHDFNNSLLCLLRSSVPWPGEGHLFLSECKHYQTRMCQVLSASLFPSLTLLLQYSSSIQCEVQALQLAWFLRQGILKLTYFISDVVLKTRLQESALLSQRNPNFSPGDSAAPTPVPAWMHAETKPSMGSLQSCVTPVGDLSICKGDKAQHFSCHLLLG